ncbi:MAG: GWxTD domain-containing protein, partial [Bacteroidales bacterium]|nr:GWxTD domain-containing protein [Bacteroidales bacterium]
INNNPDTLKFYIRSLRPIATPNEFKFIDTQVKKADMETMKNFFSSFWSKRDMIDPNSEWIIYKEQVDFVNKWYTTPINQGFETDRGIVYLKYGTPNDIYVSKHEPSAYPYEIWQYYRVGVENNRRFVFYNPNIVGEEYQLLHSDVTGEIKNPNWERFLNVRNNSMYNFDQRSSDDHWGGRAIDEYRK